MRAKVRLFPCVRALGAPRPSCPVRQAARLVSVAVLATAAACSRAPQPPAEPDNAAVAERTVTHGDVAFRMTLNPARVHLDRDVLLTLETRAPRHMAIGLPPLADRVQGFILGGQFEDPALTEDDRVVRRVHARLTPIPGASYRIAPLAVTVTDGRVSPARTTWFPTPPWRLDMASVWPDATDDAPRFRLEPVWIYPPFRVVARYALIALSVLGLLWIGRRLLTRARETVRLRRMSPRERAVRELAALLARDLVGQGHVKDFYVELTFIVRRYIERAHHIRAPELTTEEFLAAARDNPHFEPQVVARLQTFLEAADLVKFAAHTPDAAAVSHAVETARRYIESDAATYEEADD